MSVAALLLSAGLYVATVAPDWVLVPDAAEYVHLADNLLKHGEYRSNAGPYALVPPGFPLVLAALIGVFGHHWVILNVCMALVAVLTLVGFFVYVQNLSSATTGAWLASALALCLPLYWVSRQLLTDVPFLCVTVWFAVALLRWQQSTARRTWLVWAVVLAAVGTSLRAVGMVLPIVLAIVVFHHRLKLVPRRLVLGSAVSIGLFIIAASPMLLFLARNAALNRPDVQHPPFRRMVQLTVGSADTSVVQHLRKKTLAARIHFRSVLADATNVDRFRTMPGPVFFLLAGLVLAPGGWILLIRQRDPLILFLVFYLPIIMVMPVLSWHTSWRYLMPALPSVLLVLWRSLGWWQQRFSRLVRSSSVHREWPNWPAAMALFAISATAGHREWMTEVKAFADRGSDVYKPLDAAYETAHWLRESTATHEPILGVGYAQFLLADRPGFLLTPQEDGKAMLALARSRDVRWVVSWKPFSPHACVADAVSGHPEDFVARFENEYWLVGEVKHVSRVAEDKSMNGPSLPSLRDAPFSKSVEGQDAREQDTKRVKLFNG